MQSKRIVKIVEVVCLSVFALFVSGCGGAELENKTFPLAVLIAQEDGQHKICYLAQQLSEVSNERADGGNMTAANASGSTYYETHQSFETKKKKKKQSLSAGYDTYKGCYFPKRVFGKQRISDIFRYRAQ